MEEVKEMLEARKNYLLQIKKEKESALATVPEGRLRICSHGNKAQFYYRTDPKDFNGVYIRDNDVKFAELLAQKDYDQRVLRAVDKELKVINKFFSDYPDTNAEQVYEKLHGERQKLVLPIKKSDQQYIREWESVKYHEKEFYEDDPVFHTVEGKRVRSKSEVIIADALSREGIPFRYEYPISLKKVGKIYPDFTVLNVRKRQEILWEHLGMMDDEIYVEKAIQKITTYEQNGIFPGENLILTYETKKNPLNQKTIMLMIQHYLK